MEEKSPSFESFNHSVWEIAVFGAGHVAQALVPLLCTLNCRVTCVDNGSEWLDKLSDHPKLTRLNPASHADVVGELKENTYIISMTQGHATDVPVLIELHKSSFKTPFVGVIGSEKKANTFKKELAEANVSDSFIEKIRCPIGLPIGNNTPEEIAISIVAQLLQVRDEK